MADNSNKKRTIRHRNRRQQIPIYFMKHLRMFVYQKEWVVLPMSALIAGMVSMVIRNGFGKNMEYTLTGAFALTCVAIWNGSFNSIQVICRERAIVKREHRSGMHITSYIIAHMLYQAILCCLQSILTVGICWRCGVAMTGTGIITRWMIVDIALTMFIISYASDMLSLLISSIVHTTTTAMTVMPFILIFQLVFSGGIFPLPKWADPIAEFTISHYGMNTIASQAHFNDLPMNTGWNVLTKMRGDVLIEAKTLEDVLTEYDLQDMSSAYDPVKLNEIVIDEITVGDLIEMAGEDDLRIKIITKTSEANQRESFESSIENILFNWMALIMMGSFYAFLATVFLEFIDKDKR